MSYYRSISCGILILVFLGLGEFGLNTLRSILKGQTLFGDDQPTASVAVDDSAESFPFNSRPVSTGDYLQLDLKLWVASASHAADHHGADNQFANLLCGYLENQSCYVLNASSPGILLEDNIDFIEGHGATWQPEYVLLYQAYLDIHHSAQRASAPSTNTSDSEPNGAKTPPRVAEQVKDMLKVDERLRSTILRNYSRNYLGSSFLLATPLLSDLPDSEKEAFKAELVHFVEEVRGMGAHPVLTTFVSAHGDSSGGINWLYQTWLMRYFEDYSPETVNRLISDYNTVIRQVGQAYGVDVIDLDRRWAAADRRGQFDDFVHFSRSGHQQVAKIIASELQGIVR